MTTTAAPTDTWTLRGITSGSGACDHCGRDLARLFRVTSADGMEMTVGRTCAKKMTGWSWTVAQAERLERMRLREESAARAFPELWAALHRQRAHEVRVAHDVVAQCGSLAMPGIIELRDTGDAIAEAYAQDMLARSIARFGPAQ